MKNCRLEIDVAGETNTGLRRRSNEDNFLVCRRDNAVVAAVCDGIGGHTGGDIASGICCNELLEAVMKQKSFPDAAGFLTGTLEQINARIFARNLREKRISPMGCTAVAAIFEADKITIANTGDSRFYKFDPGRKPALQQISRDHRISEADARKLAEIVNKDVNELLKQVITHSIGAKPHPTVDIYSIRPETGAIYLLCSDGLSSFVPETKIGELLSSSGNSARQITSALMRQALICGGDDNISIITVLYPPNEKKG